VCCLRQHYQKFLHHRPIHLLKLHDFDLILHHRLSKLL
jgi:hypothetical protein